MPRFAFHRAATGSGAGTVAPVTSTTVLNASGARTTTISNTTTGPVASTVTEVFTSVPIPAVRRVRKRMVAGIRVSGKHGEYVDNPLQVEGSAKKREEKMRLYGYVMESSGSNKYLVHFDNNLEKVCSSSTLKIEA